MNSIAETLQVCPDIFPSLKDENRLDYSLGILSALILPIFSSISGSLPFSYYFFLNFLSAAFASTKVHMMLSLISTSLSTLSFFAITVIYSLGLNLIHKTANCDDAFKHCNDHELQNSAVYSCKDCFDR